mgnify:CR=1 FL=1
MLRIRPDQLRALDEPTSEFLARTEQHLREVWTEECDELGQTGVREHVLGAFADARAHGLTSEFDVVRFIDLSMAFGRDFPGQAWCVSLFERTRSEGSAALDVDALWRAAEAELDRRDEDREGP